MNSAGWAAIVMSSVIENLLMKQNHFQMWYAFADIKLNVVDADLEIPRESLSFPKGETLLVSPREHEADD